MDYVQPVELATPSRSRIVSSLFWADCTVLWRNRRASILTVVVPLIILVFWRAVVKQAGGPFALSSCLMFGLVGIGVIGYSNLMARDRERGVFQRLRVTPTTTWDIMVSRLLVQLMQMLVMSGLVFVGAFVLDQIVLTSAGYVLALVAALVGGAVFLGLGQAMVGLIASADTLDAVTRLVYFVFIIVGALGELGALGQPIQAVVTWSPYGTIKAILFAAMQAAAWDGHAWLGLVLTVAYAAVFTAIGIRRFKWSS